MLSIPSLSSIVPTNNRYDFTNLTSKEAISAGADLADKGVITGDQFAVLAGSTSALSSVAIGGNQVGGINPLDSPVKSNFLDGLKDSIAYLNGLGGKDSAETNGLKTSESLLTALNEYQYGTAEGLQVSGTNVSAQA